MKREMDIGFDGSVSPTRESVTRSQTQASSSTSCCNRVKGTQVNGYIVYTRVKKSRINYGVEYSDNLRNENLEDFKKLMNSVKEALTDEDRDNKISIEASNVISNEIKGVRGFVEGGPLVEASIEESRIIGENAIVGNLVVEEIGRDGRPAVQSRLREVSSYNSAMFMPKDDSVHQLETMTCLVEKRGFEGSSMQMVESSDGSNDDVCLKALRRCRQSLSIPKVEAIDNLEFEQQTVKYGFVSNFDGEETGEESGLTTPWKNLELKMSKKVSLTKCPMTVKELFDTGLLDGVPVVYMGTISSKTAGLRGIITDGGILCSCSLCKGRRVVPPSQFEIHACKQYKRAAQYICFENGKSLLEVLRACRRRRLHTLEATIQNIVSALPEQRTFTCRKCKGSFHVIHAGQTGLLCNSCIESKKSQCSTRNAPSAGASSLETALVSKSVGNASLSISPSNKSQWKQASKQASHQSCI